VKRRFLLPPGLPGQMSFVKHGFHAVLQQKHAHRKIMISFYFLRNPGDGSFSFCALQKGNHPGR